MDEHMNQMFLGLIAYMGSASTEVQVDVVGIFSSELAAKDGIDEFIESCLEQERPGYSALKVMITDISLGEQYRHPALQTDVTNDNVPF